MPNLRYIFRLISAFFIRFRTLILLGFILGILIFLVARVVLPFFLPSSIIKIGMTGRYTASTLPDPILHMIGRGLTKLGSDGSVEPDISSSWETPDRGKTWIFHLRQDTTWQDGKKLTSSNVSYAFSDVTIERPDAKTIVFKLQNPYSAFPSVVSRPTFKSGLLGTGEWEVKNLSLVGNLIDQITLEKKNRARVIYRFYPTEDRTKLAFELGQVNSIQGIFDARPFSSWPKVKIDENTDTGEFVAVFFNNQDKLLSDKTFRQALSYAINKEVLGGLRAISPISIGSWAYNPQVKPYDYDLAKAKSSIADYKKSSKIDRIILNFNAPPVLLSQAERIKKDWEDAGVTVNLQVMSNVPSDYQALLAIFDIPDDPDQYPIWHSTQTATNITHYSSPRIDKLLEDGRTEIDLRDRKQTYFDFQRFLVEDSPAAFLYYPTTFTIKGR